MYGKHRAEHDWADGERGGEQRAPVYPDGSPVNECWDSRVLRRPRIPAALPEKQRNLPAGDDKKQNRQR